jgi:hypothetical protein
VTQFRVLSAALVGMVILASCGRREETKSTATRETRDTTHRPPPYVNPAEIPHPAPPQPTGPQIGRTDPLMNAIGPELAEWVAMWGTVLPRFKVDSLWGGKPQKWVPVAHELQGGFAHRYDESDRTFRILGIPSPDGRRILDIDSYQVAYEVEGGFDAGGEPESKPTLIDRDARTETDIAFCGTPCGFHWGRWLAPHRFALAGWSDADDYSQWKQGNLSVYDLRDSTVTTYVTRIVSRGDYDRYYSAWKQWLMKRDRETRPRT